MPGVDRKYTLMVKRTLEQEAGQPPQTLLVDVAPLESWEDEPEEASGVVKHFIIHNPTHQLITQNFIRHDGYHKEFHFTAQDDLLELLKYEGDTLSIFDGPSDLDYMHPIRYETGDEGRLHEAVIFAHADAKDNRLFKAIGAVEPED